MLNNNEHVRSIVEGYFDAIQGVNEAAIDLALEFLADDVVWINPGAIKQEGQYVGKAAVRELLMSAIPEVYEPGSFRNLGRHTLVERDKAVTTYDASSRTANGDTYEQHYVIEFEVRDDKIVYVRENFDTLHFHNLIYGQASDDSTAAPAGTPSVATVASDRSPWACGTYPKDRLSHVVFCVAPADFDDCRDYWAKAHGVDFEVIPLPDEFGLRVVFSLANGIEIISPTGPDAPLAIREFLESHGNGIYSVVYNVPDLSAAVDRAAPWGVDEIDRNIFSDIAPWSTTYRVLEESNMTPFRGLRAMFAQIELH